ITKAPLRVPTSSRTLLIPAPCPSPTSDVHLARQATHPTSRPCGRPAPDFRYLTIGKMTAVKARPYHHGDLRAALLEAVAEVVREGGLGQVSLREVARRVPVTHAAAAHHFGNKAGLLTALATQGYSLLGASIMDSVLAAH